MQSVCLVSDPLLFEQRPAEDHNDLSLVVRASSITCSITCFLVLLEALVLLSCVVSDVRRSYQNEGKRDQPI